MSHENLYMLHHRLVPLPRGSQGVLQASQCAVPTHRTAAVLLGPAYLPLAPQSLPGQLVPLTTSTFLPCHTSEAPVW